METFCRYFNQNICKSCDLITLNYVDQIKLKQEKLIKGLEGLEFPPLEPTVASSELGFRNKAKFSITGTVENPVIGLIGEDTPDNGRELLECSLHVPQINELLPEIKQFIRLANLRPYSINERKGELKGIILFHSSRSNETYARLILRSKESLDRIKKNLTYLTSKFPNLKCISVNIQPVPQAILEGEEEIFMTERTFIYHRLGEVVFSLDPKAFVQTNQIVAEKLYSTAAEWVKDSSSAKFMELFCGQGAFSFYAAPFIKSGLGIEINQEAVKTANRTARENNMDYLKFKCADASEVSEDIKNFGPDLILVNPPRRGLSGATKLLLEAEPDTIIYSSCNHETLTSDLKALSSRYEIKAVQIFDMFPHTSHFETLVKLSLKDD